MQIADSRTSTSWRLPKDGRIQRRLDVELLAELVSALDELLEEVKEWEDSDDPNLKLTVRRILRARLASGKASDRLEQLIEREVIE